MTTNMNENLNMVSTNPRVHHGRNARKLREASGLSLNKLAEKMQVSHTTVHRYENAPILKDDIIEKIAIALEVPPSILKSMEEEGTIQFGFENKDCTIGNIVNGTIHITNPIETVTEIGNQMIEMGKLLLQLSEKLQNKE